MNTGELSWQQFRTLDSMRNLNEKPAKDTLL